MTAAGQAFLFAGELLCLSFAAIPLVYFADRLRCGLLGGAPKRALQRRESGDSPLSRISVIRRSPTIRRRVTPEPVIGMRCARTRWLTILRRASLLAGDVVVQMTKCCRRFIIERVFVSDSNPVQFNRA
jgi:hypothetical protein